VVVGLRFVVLTSAQGAPLRRTLGGTFRSLRFMRTVAALRFPRKRVTAVATAAEGCLDRAGRRLSHL
jgi:hypothetical protein